jgi:hypothetical protein
MKNDGKMWVQALYTCPLNAHFLAAIEYWWIISWNVILQSLSKETVRTTTVKNVMMGMDHGLPVSTLFVQKNVVILWEYACFIVVK